MKQSECIFCKIAAGEAPAVILYKDEEITAFNDSRPIAPVHVLIIPNRHIESINDIRQEDEQIFGKMIRIAKEIAFQHKLNERGYRLLFNTGAEAGQTVYHVHLHLIGGRHLPFHFK